MFSSLHNQTKIAVISAFIIVGLIVGLIMSFALNMILPKNTPVSKEEKKNVVQQTVTDTTTEQKKQDESATKNTTKEQPKAEAKKEGNKKENKKPVTPRELVNGRYTVGKDIDEGLYKLISTGSGESYFRVTDGKGDDTMNSLEDMMFFNFTYVNLKNGQVISTIDVKLVPKKSMTPYNGSQYISGQYKVGYDIPEGYYTVTPKGDIGNVRLSSSPSSSDELFSQYIEKDATIKIKNGQYLTINNVELKQ